MSNECTCKDCYPSDSINYILKLGEKCRDTNKPNEYFQKIISALRGPDWTTSLAEQTHELKQYTTARIRHIVIPKYKGDVRVAPLGKGEQEKRNTLLGGAPSHFSMHYYEACDAIKRVFKYDLINERDVE